MKRVQAVLLAVYFVLTALILILVDFFHGSPGVNYFKFAVMFSLQASIRFALAGYLMLISDIGVAASHTIGQCGCKILSGEPMCRHGH